MTESPGGPRTPAVNLWITFRHDGAVLLELLADGYTMLGMAESHAEDLEGTMRILTAWALRPDSRAYRRLEHSPLEVIEDERYLRIAEDERARRHVAQLDNEVSRLYGRCMDIER